VTNKPGRQLRSGFGSVMQGFIETSNVNVVSEITNLISAQRAYEMNSKVITASDEMLSTEVLGVYRYLGPHAGKIGDGENARVLLHRLAERQVLLDDHAVDGRADHVACQTIAAAVIATRNRSMAEPQREQFLLDVAVGDLCLGERLAAGEVVLLGGDLFLDRGRGDRVAHASSSRVCVARCSLFRSAASGSPAAQAVRPSSPSRRDSSPS
jgi:hypothetical protein